MTGCSWTRAVLEETAFALLRTSPTLGFRVIGALGPAHLWTSLATIFDR